MQNDGIRHGSETCIRGYPFKSISILMGNTRIDWVQIRVRGLSNFFKRDQGWGQGCHYPSYTHSRTRPDNEIIKILFITY